MPKKSYGLTKHERAFLHRESKGLCAICQQEPYENKKLVIDHCHRTGKVRNLLCQSCNLGLGLFKDNPNALRTAAAYVLKYKSIHMSDFKYESRLKRVINGYPNQTTEFYAEKAKLPLELTKRILMLHDGAWWVSFPSIPSSLLSEILWKPLC